MPRLEAALLRQALTASKGELRANIEEQGRVLCALRDCLLKELNTLMELATPDERDVLAKTTQAFIGQVNEALRAADGEPPQAMARRVNGR